MLLLKENKRFFYTFLFKSFPLIVQNKCQGNTLDKSFHFDKSLDKFFLLCVGQRFKFEFKNFKFMIY